MTLTRARDTELRQAATRLFRERGFHATSMQDLAEALDLNKGSLYHYIASKDELLWTIVSEALERLEAQVRPLLCSDLPGAERLHAAIVEHLRFAADHGDELALLQIELRSLPPGRRTTIIERRDAYEALWRDAIQAGIDEGKVRADTPVRFAGITILSACNWFAQWYRPDGPLSVDELAQMLGDLFWRGLRAEEAP
ncbi:MAG: TetR/AcrR family transcriptional regulator [Chloroflexi bacterium]|nr:TetR/AcrR family transcriptional regulator [Chloroflexota bacterium]